jgi:hypothetical protein
MYCKHVNLNKRGDIIPFLKKHFRYHTMNSWNHSTSYANNIKLYNIDKPADINGDTWWGMLGITVWQEILSDLLEHFGRTHNWLWQAGINGRSGGYVVLYQGGIKPSGYQSYCIHCGQKNFQPVSEDQKGICGRCNAKERVNFKQAHMQVFTCPGKSVDMDEDFHGWDMPELKDRIELVQDFDRLCDNIVNSFIKTCRGYRIVEEEILVPETVKILEPV